MKKFFIFAFAAAVLCGCNGRVGNMKLGTSEYKIEHQMSGLETKADVRDAFGTPNLIFDKEGREYYEYKTITGHGRYHWMIPVVGWVMSWWQDTFTYCETNLFVGFDADDKIADWDVVQTRGTTN